MTAIAADPPDAPSTKASLSSAELRDRFVAFAFAAADLLVETDIEGRVLFAVGASTRLLGKPAENLVGLQLEDLICPADRGLTRAMLRRSSTKTRVGPLKLRGSHDEMLMTASLLRSSNDDHIYLTLARITGPLPDAGRSTRCIDQGLAGGTMCRREFQDTIARQISGGKLDNLVISMVHVLALATKTEDETLELKNAVAGVLRCLSVDGDAVAQLAPGRYAVFTDLARTSEIEGELRQTIDESGLALSTDVVQHSLALSDPMIRAEDLLQAVNHVMTTFAAGAANSKSVQSLAEAVEERLATTRLEIDRTRQIIRRRTFTMVFQPIFDLRKLTPSHFEALARFEANQSPAEFVAFAEEVGLIVDFDLAVVETILHRLSKMKRQGGRLSIAVNISARSLSSDVFVDRIGLLFAEHYEAARHLLFEITETSQIIDLDRVDRIIQNWRKKGFKICIDDFGAGAAAFHYIRGLTVDFIKLDGGYVGRHLRSERDASILRAMISLGHNLKVATIAEMIEEQGQLESLRALGADYGQGYLLGYPADEMTLPPLINRQAIDKPQKGTAPETAQLSPACV
ncbi:MAG: EAL domain-containing protein [Pseudomonadota bacterium]